MIYNFESVHLYHLDNFLFFFMNMILFQSIMFVPLRVFYKEKLSLNFALVSSVFCFIYFLMFADFLERLFFGMLIVNGYLVIFGIVLIFTLFNLFLYGKDSEFQVFLFFNGLFMIVWFFGCQFLTFYIYEKFKIGFIGSFYIFVMLGIPIFIKLYSFCKKRFSMDKSFVWIFAIAFWTLFLFLNTINVMLFTFKETGIRILITENFIGKNTFQSFRQNVSYSFINVDKHLSKIFFFGIVASLPIISIFQLIIRKQIDEKFIDLQVKREEELKKYISMIESINQETRQLQHDIGNVLSSLGIYIYQDHIDTSSLRQFYDEVNHEFGLRKITNIPTGKLEYIKDPEIMGLVLEKVMRAKELDVRLNIEIEIAIKFPSKRLVPIIRILAILLDNALEESTRFSASSVRLAFIQLQENQILTMIENQTDNLNFIQDYQSRNIESSKGENRGQGLRIVNSLIKENRNLHLDYKQEGRKVLFSLLMDGEG